VRKVLLHIKAKPPEAKKKVLPHTKADLPEVRKVLLHIKAKPPEAMKKVLPHTKADLPEVRKVQYSSTFTENHLRR
jgi:hypothetical protein